jgi:hypothetical protein
MTRRSKFALEIGVLVVVVLALLVASGLLDVLVCAVSQCSMGGP